MSSAADVTGAVRVTSRHQIMKLDRRTPVCQPLYTVEQVLAWEPGNDDLCVSRTARSSRELVDGPKTLICHDMRGGYLEDRLVQGCFKSDCYRFYHWQYVDIFVYFSHHFVTIPPTTWTVPAHRHGVKMLGTLITEWDDGKRRCNTFLESEQPYKEFADKLVQISRYYGFDGWLVNIENVIEEEGKVENLQKFVGYLTEQQHKYDPTSEVIWYDSVINTGKLAWQDELNDKNRMFFDVCDGIFLNYCWKDENLKASKALAVEAGRPYDVYVGIDVFGRGCLGGGGFNTCEALGAALSHDLSAALFANGWVYEKHDKKDFVQNENKFWSCLSDLCSPRCITSLPIATTFCQGQGQQYWSEGKVIGGPWYNQSVQQLQPSFTGAQFNSEEFAPFQPVMESWTDEALTGGNSLRIGGMLGKGQTLQFKLFSLDVEMNQYSPRSLFVSFTYKPQGTLDCNVSLTMELNKYRKDDPKASTKTLLYLPETRENYVPFKAHQEQESDSDILVSNWVDMSQVPAQLRSQGSDSGLNGWKTFYFEIDEAVLKDVRLGLVSVVITSHSELSQTVNLLLGELQIIPASCIPESFPMVMFGETVYHPDQPSIPLINAEDNKLDCDVTKEEEEGVAGETTEGDSEQKEQTSLASEGTENSSTDSDTVQSIDNDTFQSADSNIKQSTDTDTVKSCDSDTNKCMECFTLQWSVPNSEFVKYYRVFQITEPPKGLKLLGLTILPCFKVTGFELASSTGAESGIGERSGGDNSVVLQSGEAKFRCLIQAIMNTGKAEALEVCKRNIKCETFRLDK